MLRWTPSSRGCSREPAAGRGHGQHRRAYPCRLSSPRAASGPSWRRRMPCAAVRSRDDEVDQRHLLEPGQAWARAARQLDDPPGTVGSVPARPESLDPAATSSQRDVHLGCGGCGRPGERGRVHVPASACDHPSRQRIRPLLQQQRAPRARARWAIAVAARSSAAGSPAVQHTNARCGTASGWASARSADARSTGSPASIARTTSARSYGGASLPALALGDELLAHAGRDGVDVREDERRDLLEDCDEPLAVLDRVDQRRAQRSQKNAWPSR